MRLRDFMEMMKPFLTQTHMRSEAREVSFQTYYEQKMIMLFFFFLPIVRFLSFCPSFCLPRSEKLSLRVLCPTCMFTERLKRKKKTLQLGIYCS